MGHHQGDPRAGDDPDGPKSGGRSWTPAASAPGSSIPAATQDIVVANMDQEKGTVFPAAPSMGRAQTLALLEDAGWATIDAAWLQANPQG